MLFESAVDLSFALDKSVNPDFIASAAAACGDYHCIAVLLKFFHISDAHISVGSEDHPTLFM